MEQTAQEELKLMIQQINELTSLYHSAVSRYRISDNEFWLWYILILTNGEHSQQDICADWFLTKQTINTIVGHMVREGYAIQRAVPGSRNRKYIYLTEAGRKYGEQVVLPIARAEQRALRRVQTTELAACSATLNKIITNLKEEISHAEYHQDR